MSIALQRTELNKFFQILSTSSVFHSKHHILCERQVHGAYVYLTKSEEPVQKWTQLFVYPAILKPVADMCQETGCARSHSKEEGVGDKVEFWEASGVL